MGSFRKKSIIIMVMVLTLCLVCSCNIKSNNMNNGYSEHFSSNSAQDSYIAENSTHIYYSNVYDQRRLYRFDLKSQRHALVAENLLMSADICADDQSVFFSAWDVSIDDSDVRNIYRLDLEKNTIALLVESALTPLVIEKKIYYMNDDAPRDIKVYDMETGATETLILGYDCSGLIYTNNCIYTISQTKGTLLRFDLETDLLQEIVLEGNPATLMLYDNSLYFYTLDSKAYGYQFSLDSSQLTKILDYNNGDFYFLGFIPTDQYVFFSGSELIDNRTTGGKFFRMNRKSGLIEQIFETAGDHFYILNDMVYIVRESGTSRSGPSVEAISFTGERLTTENAFTNDMSSASIITEPLITKFENATDLIKAAT